MAQGSDLNYQYAGLSGEGGFDAATTEEGLRAGCRLRPGFLAPGRVPASMLKNVDSTILDTVDAFVAGQLEQGSSTTSGSSDGGLAVVFDDELAPPDVQDDINDLAEEIAAGDIEMPGRLTRPAMLRLAGITKSFGSVVAVADAELTIRRGSITAVVGENGAGKTTLMRVLAGELSPDNGHAAWLDGERITIVSTADAIAHGITMVHQHFALRRRQALQKTFVPRQGAR